jgi:hypothetical protein
MEGPRLVTSPATGGGRRPPQPCYRGSADRGGSCCPPVAAVLAELAGFTGTYVVYSRHTQSSGSSS